MLIIEDGTGKPDSQAYASVDELRAWAGARNLPVPSNDSEGNLKIEGALIEGADWLEAMRCYQGQPTSVTQAMPFPRSGVYVNDVLLEDNVIPRVLKIANIRLAMDVLNGVILMPTISGNASDFVIKEKVGPLETEYADPTKFDGTATFTAVNALLQPLLGVECGHGFFTVFRA